MVQLAGGGLSAAGWAGKVAEVGPNLAPAASEKFRDFAPLARTQYTFKLRSVALAQLRMRLDS